MEIFSGICSMEDREVEEEARAASIKAVLEMALAVWSGFRAKGEDLNAEVTVTFDEAAFGCDKRIRLSLQNGQTQTLRCIFQQELKPEKYPFKRRTPGKRRR